MKRFIDEDEYEELEDYEGSDELEDDEDEDEPRSFTVRGKTYIVRITKKRLDLYEQRHKPIMASFIQNDGAFSSAELTALLAYGLCEEGGAFVKPNKGMEMADKLMKKSGYLAVYQAVIEALERDCGFLFRSA